jgi:hypothetical protein
VVLPVLLKGQRTLHRTEKNESNILLVAHIERALPSETEQNKVPDDFTTYVTTKNIKNTA